MFAQHSRDVVAAYRWPWISTSFLALGAMLLGPAARCLADLGVFNSRPLWEAAVSYSYHLEDFADTELEPGLSITSTTETGGIVDGAWADRVTLGSYTSFGFVPAVVGFGGNWDLSPGGPGMGIVLTLTLETGGTSVVNSQIPNTYTGEFFGIVSDLPFTDVRLEVGTQGGVAETYTLDNMVYCPVPEPSLTALPTGIVACFLLCRSRRMTGS